MSKANNSFMGLEHLTDEELEEVQGRSQEDAPAVLAARAVRETNNRWDFGKAHGLGSHESPMAGNYASVGISQDRVYKAELSHRCDDPVHLLLGKRPRIARITREMPRYRGVSPPGVRH